MLLAKTDLPEGHIDAAIGEPDIIGSHFMEVIGPQIPSADVRSMLSQSDLRQYPYPAGHKELVSILSDRFGAPVVITNGAKQGLAACLYAVHYADEIKSIQFRSPYWALLPPLVESMNLKWETSFDQSKRSATLLVSPNNPDGWVAEDDFDLQQFAPVIHDGAYYSKAYLPEEYVTKPIGQLQVFSFSKMLGLPGLRLGFVVCHDEKYYDHLVNYMESYTVGVSNITQEFMAKFLSSVNPFFFDAFNRKCRSSLNYAKELISKVDPEVLDVPKPETYHGMFVWCRVINESVINASKVKFAHGQAFGQPGFIRINLAMNPKVLEEVVHRLND